MARALQALLLAAALCSARACSDVYMTAAPSRGRFLAVSKRNKSVSGRGWRQE